MKNSIYSRKIRTLLSAFLILISTGWLFGDSGMILEWSGEVIIESDGESAQARTGQDLQPGNIVYTGIDSSVLILLSDGTRIDLFSNSRLQISDTEPAQNSDGSFLGRLWQSIKEKFADTGYSSAQSGGVGALRASMADEEIFDDDLDEADLAELAQVVASIDSEGLPGNTTALMLAVVYEEFGQFESAEGIYLKMIADFPNDPVTYDMLIDLYLKIDFYAHAQDALKKRPHSDQ